MPIKVQCKCGKALSVPDTAAGKSIRCPGCQATVAVPAAGTTTKPTSPAQSTTPAKNTSAKAAPANASKPNPAKPSPAKPNLAKPSNATPAMGASDLSDLFDQEGFKAQTGPTCPNCHAPLRPNAALCTSCGMNLQTGERVATSVVARASSGGGGHGHGGDGGEAALAHAREMMARDQRLQEKLVRGSGLPWWVLLIILMVLIGSGVVGAVTMVAIFTEDPSKLGTMGVIASMNKLALYGIVLAVAFSTVFNIAHLIAIVAGFKESVGQGFLVMFVPFYNFYYAIRRWKDLSGVFWMMLISTLGNGAAVGMIVGGSMMG